MDFHENGGSDIMDEGVTHKLSAALIKSHRETKVKPSCRNYQQSDLDLKNALVK